MTIAGSDPSGGAGVQADLKTFTNLGLHGITVITCVTAQNTQKVKTIHKLPAELIEKQIDTLFEDMKPTAVKTGMLFDEDIVKSVTKKIKQYKMRVIVDPVMTATSKDSLSSKNLTKAIKKELLPNAYILTPNTDEARILTDIKIENINNAQSACKKLYEKGPKYILIKGGHLKGKTISDVFYDGKKFSTFSLPRIPNKKAHGSGCTLSALITGYTALGDKPVDAVKKSKHVLWNMIKHGYKPGKGSDVLNFDYQIITNPMPPFTNNECYDVWISLEKAIDKLLNFLPNDFIPEVGMNFGYALPNAKKYGDVCAINGRIIKTKNKPVKCGLIEFGSSKHIASIIFEAMKSNKNIRCAINLKYSIGIIDQFKKLDFKIGSFDRKNEPNNVKSTMEWGTNRVIRKIGFVPDVIYDTGSVGKEPMIRVLGKNPDDVLKKVYRLIKK
jgi:hydroxymethylpyrimidine/phosphomethylpyrimidine kinase